jgi:putative flippase GtrA
MALVTEWIRHHAGSLLATGIDFGVMVTLVEVLHTGAVAATIAGALCGALANFFMGRHWVFHQAQSGAAGQFFRYGAVAAVSLGLNALGEHILVVRAQLGYLLARVIIAVLVANLWNYPMHKFWVFKRN